MSVDNSTPVASREQFLRDLDACKLTGSDEDIRRALESLPPDADTPATAQHLVALGALSPYQADAVLGRRFEDLRIGQYEVLGRIGAGGMGTVFRARHPRMKRVVALKTLSAEGARTERFLRRFQREVETVARLTHPNIVMAFDADESPAGPFLVMEYVEGRDLASEVKARGPLPPAEAVDCVLQAARGLEYAHARGIVHRDIKPANLLRDAAGVVKVADLGLARLAAGESGVDTSITQAGGVVGTVDYMSPEQAVDSTAIDHRADIYSLGCTLHFLLTGLPPFRRSTLMALLLAHQDAPIPSLAEARPGLPDALDEVFRRMIAKRPDDRPRSISEVIGELEALLASGTLGPVPPAGPAPAPGGGSPETESSDFVGATGSAAVTIDVGSDPSPSDLLRVSDLAVLLVEPSRTQAGIVGRFLDELGLRRPLSSRSGREALELARAGDLDVVLCSTYLPDMSGTDLAAAILGDPGCQHVGFVLATSESEAGGEAPILPDSPRAVLLPKPFDLRTLARSLAQAAGMVEPPSPGAEGPRP